MSETFRQYDSAAQLCRDIFIKKLADYGSSWRILRTSSITDQIFIKAQRIRSIEEKGMMKVNEDIRSEYIGIINYSAIALIQIRLSNDAGIELSVDEAGKHYDTVMEEARSLMEAKNHDYNEAWRDMRISSLTDIILMRLLRIKQIEDNQGKTLVSEGVDSNYSDMINYGLFALIKIEEAKTKG